MIDFIKKYIRHDEDTITPEEEEILLFLIDAADEYLKNATGLYQAYSIPLYKMAVLLLVAEWAEYRGIRTSIQFKEQGFSLSSLLTQLLVKGSEQA